MRIVSRNIVSVLAALLLLSGCGPAIWTVSNPAEINESFDGALLSYTLASGVVQFSATYTAKDGGLLTLTTDQTVKAVPDFAHQHTLAYNHEVLSTDEISIEFDGALLKKVSSTTKDETVASIQAVNSLLSQAAATQKALDREVKSILKMDTPPTKPCTDIKVSRAVNVTHRRQEKAFVQQPSIKDSDCTVTINISVSEPTNTLGVAGFIKPPAEHLNERQCDFAVCFRLGANFNIAATATLRQAGAVLATAETAFSVLAPRADRLGYVRFNRRAFVQNTTTLAWNNGVVSQFAAKNPSEVLGFIALPTALLGTVALTAALIP